MKKLLNVGLILLFVVFLASCSNSFTNKNDVEHLHTFSVWSIEKEGSCLEGGTQKRTCSECNYVERKSVPAIGHNIVSDEAVMPTCTKTGRTAGLHCDECGVTIVAQTIIPALGHSEVEDRAISPTCLTSGKTSGSHCEVCGYIFVAQKSIEAQGHTKVEDRAVPATCMEDGKTSGSHCGDCGEIIVKQQTIEAQGHTKVEDKAISATCTTSGKTAGSHCEDCGEVIDKQIVTPVLGHKVVCDDAVMPTCLMAGKTAGLHCDECGEVIVNQNIIPALGHSEIIDLAVSPTCLVSGKTAGSHCGLCGEIIKEQETIDVVMHTIVEDKAVPATCTTSGVTAGSHCGVCGKIMIYQKLTQPTGHKYDSGVVKTTATCVKNGVIKYSCVNTDCDHYYEEEYALPTYTASEIYENAIKFVGEITTYNQYGYALTIGSGFVCSSDGVIVTNYHVIEGCYSAKITINKVTYSVDSILAYDASIDLALLKINVTGLDFAKICKEPVKVGETVFAMGSPKGYTSSITQGIVSHADRTMNGVSAIQHDASVTNGNSGGPLINAYGEVIGINTWIVADSENLNFAVSVNEIDNLNYGNSQTLSEFYQEVHYQLLEDEINPNGSFD